MSDKSGCVKGRARDDTTIWHCTLSECFVEFSSQESLGDVLCMCLTIQSSVAFICELLEGYANFSEKVKSQKICSDQTALVQRLWMNVLVYTKVNSNPLSEAQLLPKIASVPDLVRISRSQYPFSYWKIRLTESRLIVPWIAPSIKEPFSESQHELAWTDFSSIFITFSEFYHLSLCKIECGAHFFEGSLSSLYRPSTTQNRQGLESSNSIGSY